MTTLRDPTSPSSGTTYSFARGPVDTTSVGGTFADQWWRRSRVTEKARAILQGIKDPRIANSTKELIEAIEEAIYALAAVKRDVDTLPPVTADLAEDGSVTLEWITPDFRLGFDVERDPNQSGWYIASSKGLGGLGLHGYLSTVDKKYLAFLIAKFALENT